MTSKKIGLAALALTGFVGCGQTTYFSVSVEVTGSLGNDRNALSQVVSAEVTASGAISGEPIFLLGDFPHDKGYNYPKASDGQLLLSRFQYGTTEESGHVDFKVDLHNGTNGQEGVIGSATEGGDIKPGATIEVAVKIDPTKFAH
jgi:hypothetical protein